MGSVLHAMKQTGVLCRVFGADRTALEFHGIAKDGYTLCDTDAAFWSAAERTECSALVYTLGVDDPAGARIPDPLPSVVRQVPLVLRLALGSRACETVGMLARRQVDARLAAWPR